MTGIAERALAHQLADDEAGNDGDLRLDIEHVDAGERHSPEARNRATSFAATVWRV
jgi:hypothetical protein